MNQAADNNKTPPKRNDEEDDDDMAGFEDIDDAIDEEDERKDYEK